MFLSSIKQFIYIFKQAARPFKHSEYLIKRS